MATTTGTTWSSGDSPPTSPSTSCKWSTHRASCRVAGDLGAVLVKSGERVKTGQWYHLACSRRGSRVALILTELGDHDPDRVSATGAIGSLACPARTPLVVGGKAAADGTVIRRESDQFNGVVDNVFFETG